MSDPTIGRQAAEINRHMAAVHGFGRIEDRDADLSPAEQAALSRLDEIEPSWRTEPGAIHEPEIREAVAAALREHEDIRPTGDTSSDGTAAGWVAAGVASSWMGHDPGDLAARVLAEVRPLVYREAAARLHRLCAADGHGGDCALTCERGSVALLLEAWAAEMGDDRG